MFLKKDVQTVRNILTNTRSNSINQANTNLVELVLGKSAINYDDTIYLISLSIAGMDKVEAENRLIEYITENENNSLKTAFEEVLRFYDSIFGIFKNFKMSVNDYIDFMDNMLSEQYIKMMEKAKENQQEANTADQDNKDNMQLDK